MLSWNVRGACSSASRRSIWYNSDFEWIDVKARGFIIEEGVVAADLTGGENAATKIALRGRRSKLDRVLVNDGWWSIGDWDLRALLKKKSDHRPLLLSRIKQNWGLVPFKVYNVWLKEEFLINSIKASHDETESEGEVSIQITLRKIRETIKKWARLPTNNIDYKIKELEKEVDIKDNVGDVTSDSVMLKQKFDELYDTKAEMIKQKSRFNWMALGDRNTKLFHQCVQKRRSRNLIRKVFWNGVWQCSVNDVKDAFFNHFKELFQSKDLVVEFRLGSLPLNRINEEEASWIERDFSMEEVEWALTSLSPEKSPGPDGFNIGAIKSMWSVLKGKLFQSLVKFSQSGSIPAVMNSSFIALVPKVVQPRSVSDYSPISLINSSSKILTKLIVERLNVVMDKLVSKNQFGFIKGRQSSDSILLINEVCHSLKIGRASGLVLKIDFEKAFDTVRWSFIDDLLNKMGFGDRWRMWISRYLNSTRISVLVNGSPTKEFAPKRGLRQDDPLSPLLFNLVVEILSKMLTQASNIGAFKGISLAADEQPISHLQFADDTVIFMEDKLENVVAIKSILHDFHLLMGLKINFSKSRLYSKGKGLEILEQAANVLGCVIREWPISYLGVTIGLSPREKIFWDPLVKKVKIS
ncbi:hypothetical protein AgCh_011356 [Apium graveolens]